MPVVNYIPLPKIGEGLGEWLKPLLMKKGLGLMEDCRGTLHKSRPSLGTLNLVVSEKKNKSGGLGCRSKPLLRTRRGSWTSQASRARAGVDGEAEVLPSEKEEVVMTLQGHPAL